MCDSQVAGLVERVKQRESPHADGLPCVMHNLLAWVARRAGVYFLLFQEVRKYILSLPPPAQQRLQLLVSVRP